MSEENGGCFRICANVIISVCVCRPVVDEEERSSVAVPRSVIFSLSPSLSLLFFFLFFFYVLPPSRSP